MKTLNKLRATTQLIKIKLLGKRVPLVVTWPITNRCNLRCRYCEEWKKAGDELSTDEVKKIITQLKELGTVRISLSGGEPLVREDIGEIINYIKKQGMSVVLTSNGTLVPEKIEEIKNADVVKLSIEGEQKVHDRIRGEGSFDAVINAANTITQIKQIGTDKTDKNPLLDCSIVQLLRRRALKRANQDIRGNPPQISENPKIVFNSVLTAYNLDQIDFLITLAKKYNTGVRFSALSTSHASQERISPLSPTPEDLVNALNKLITAKKEGEPVLNSIAGLRYFKKQILNPEPCPLSPGFRCYAGRAFAHISSDGKLYPCVMLEGKVPGQNVQELGIEPALKRATMSTVASFSPGRRASAQHGSSRSEEARPKGRYCKNFTQCGGCFCAGTLELNLLLNFKPSAIWNARNLL